MEGENMILIAIIIGCVIGAIIGIFMPIIPYTYSCLLYTSDAADD